MQKQVMDSEFVSIITSFICLIENVINLLRKVIKYLIEDILVPSTYCNTYNKKNKTNFFEKKKSKHKDQHRTILQHRHLHALAKSATSEVFKLLNLSGRFRNLIAELLAKTLSWTVHACL